MHCGSEATQFCLFGTDNKADSETWTLNIGAGTMGLSPWGQPPRATRLPWLLSCGLSGAACWDRSHTERNKAPVLVLSALAHSAAQSPSDPPSCSQKTGFTLIPRGSLAGIKQPFYRLYTSTLSPPLSALHFVDFIHNDQLLQHYKWLR